MSDSRRVPPTQPKFEDWAKKNAYDLTRAKTHGGYKHSSTVYAEIGFNAALEAGVPPTPDERLGLWFKPCSEDEPGAIKAYWNPPEVTPNELTCQTCKVNRAAGLKCAECGRPYFAAPDELKAAHDDGIGKAVHLLDDEAAHSAYAAKLQSVIRALRYDREPQGKESDD